MSCFDGEIGVIAIQCPHRSPPRACWEGGKNKKTAISMSLVVRSTEYWFVLGLLLV